MSHEVESLAYNKSGGVPWHGLGVPVANDMSVDDMLIAAGLDWTVSRRSLYFPKIVAEGAPTSLRVVPDEFALVRDSDESVLDTIGSNFKPVQNAEIMEFFRRFCEAGDMEMETAGSLKNGKFVWALARIKAGFTIGKNDETRGYMLLSQPHQFGYSLTAALTPVRVVCWNTLNYALGSRLDGARGSSTKSFRMVHSRAFDDGVKAQAETALGLATEKMVAFGHAAEFLSKTRANSEQVTDYFRGVLQIERPEDDTEEARASAEEEESRNMRRFREALISAPGQDMSTTKGTYWGLVNSVSYVVDHEMGRTDDNRLFSAWYGRGAATKVRAVELAIEHAKMAA